MDPTDLITARWHRLFAAVLCGGLFGVLAWFIAATVRLEGTSSAHFWMMMASFGFGFALGVPTGVAIYAGAASRRERVILPRAQLLVSTPCRAARRGAS